MENLYRCHYTSNLKLSENNFGYLFRKFNNEILLICNSQFKRGDIVKVVDIDYQRNIITLEVVKDYDDTVDYPILMIISTTIPFRSGLVPIVELSDTYKVLFSIRTSYLSHQFYNALISISKIPVTVRVNYAEEDNPDEVVYDAEWTIRKERSK